MTNPLPKMNHSDFIIADKYIMALNTLLNAGYYRDPDSPRWYSPTGKREFQTIWEAYEYFILYGKVKE